MLCKFGEGLFKRRVDCLICHYIVIVIPQIYKGKFEEALVIIFERDFLVCLYVCAEVFFIKTGLNCL